MPLVCFIPPRTEPLWHDRFPAHSLVPLHLSFYAAARADCDGARKTPNTAAQIAIAASFVVDFIKFSFVVNHASSDGPDYKVCADASVIHSVSPLARKCAVRARPALGACFATINGR